MNLDSFSFSLIRFKHGTNRSHLFLVSLIKFTYGKKGSHLLLLMLKKFKIKKRITGDMVCQRSMTCKNLGIVK